MKGRLAQVEELLDDEQLLLILGGLRATNAPEHIPLCAPSAKILFCGDSLVAENNWTLRYSRGMNTWDEDRAKRRRIRLALKWASHRLESKAQIKAKTALIRGQEVRLGNVQAQTTYPG